MGDKEKRLGTRKKCLDSPDVIWDGRELDWVEPKPHRLYLRGVGYKYLVNQYYEEGFRNLLEDYKPKKKYPLALILPCSYGKPYSQSYIHYNIRKAIKDFLKKELIHEIIVTNAGVVPRELDEHWPYTAYDWNPRYETPQIKKCYTEILSERIKQYFEKHGNYYKKIAAYLRWDSDSWRAVEKAMKQLGKNIVNLTPKSISPEEIDEASLQGLYEDPDIQLITNTSLKSLKIKLGMILGDLDN